MLEPKRNQDYFIQDLGGSVELTSTLLYGLVGGIVDITNNGYKPNYDGCTVRGNVYIIPAFKHSEEMVTDHQKDLEEKNNIISGKDKDIAELKKELESLRGDLKKSKDENRTSKSTITKLRNKINSLEKNAK